MAYTYDDFLAELKRTGYTMSDADMALAKKNPEVGISLLSLGEDYNKATTPEGKLLAHKAAEELRKSYGGYSGGEDGSGYIPTGGTVNTGSFTTGQQVPVYENQYAAQQKQLLDELMNREQFSYDKDNDPTWSSYKKSYLREGERASADALGEAAAASGGRPSTFAMTAATQAGDYYAAKLNDMLPQLEQQAYGRYVDEGNAIYQQLQQVNAMEQSEYAKYLNALEQENIEHTKRLAELERQEKTAQQAQTLAQGQVDAIIAAGGTPSSELAAAAGYSNEYVAALVAAVAEKKAAEAAAAATKQTGNSNTKAYKPSLTLPQTLAAIESGILSDTVLKAYEYYYGQSYDSGEPEFETIDGIPSFSFDQDEGIYSFNGKQYSTVAELQKAIEDTPMTEEQLDGLVRKIKMYGVPVDVV